MAQEPSRAPDAPSSRKFGQYNLIKKLGQGAMGAVFLAEDSMLLRQVAIKVLPKNLAANQEFLARFKREAQAAGRLQHPNIVGAYAVGEENGIPYYVMEYCPGESLEGVLKRTSRLPWQEAVELAKQVAHGLGYAHAQGLLHRDIKPGNILVTPEQQAKILDLGLAKQVGEDASSGFQTMSGMAVGTPHYIAPEQARGEKTLDGRADIYSLGATLYHLITGRTPFVGATSAAIMALHLTAEPPSPGSLVPGLPDGLLQVLSKMMAKTPAERYADCTELIEDLDALLSGHAPQHAPRLVATRPGGRGQGRGITTGPRAPVTKTREDGTPSTRAPLSKPGRPMVPIAAIGAAVLVILVIFLISGRGADEVQPRAAKTTTSALSAPPKEKTPAPPAPAPVAAAPAPPVASVPNPPSPTAAREPLPLAPAEPVRAALEPPSTPQPATPPATAPAIEEATGKGPAVAAESPAQAPAVPPKPALRLQTALEWALSDEPFAQSEAKIRAELEHAEPAEKEGCEQVARLLNGASAIPAAALRQVRNSAGTRIKVVLQEGGPRLMAVEKGEKDALWVDLGAGQHPFRLEELSHETILGLAKLAMGSERDGGERLAAHAVLRGDPDAARRNLEALSEAGRGVAEKLLEQRARKMVEARAAEETAKFLALAAANKHKEAIAVGEQIVKTYAGTAVLQALRPPMDQQLDELRARLTGLNGVFLCDWKKLPDGRVQLDFDFSKPSHCLELLNRSLAVVFSEIDADLTCLNDGRWHRVFYLGDAILTHIQKGGQTIEYEKKREVGKGTLPTGSTGPDPWKGAVRRYRFKAGPQGISFQIDDEKAQTMAVPWKGGRIKWPSHNVVHPEKMTITGRLDPRWLAEMSEAVADRTQFAAPGAAYVALKPKTRALPRTELEPWFDAWGFNPNPDLESRSIVGWYEIGPSWTLDKGELVSPNPPQTHSSWISWFWPAALVSAYAEIAFEAQVEKGALEIRLPAQRENHAAVTASWHYVDLLIFEKDSVRIDTSYFFGGHPMRTDKNLSEKIRKPIPPAKPGQWQKIQVLNRKDSVQVFIDSQLVLDFKHASSDKLTMAFLAHPMNAYRLRNIRIRKLD